MKTLKPGEIATYCDVHHRTVSRWIANGQLKGHKLPGRGNYRVLLDDFLLFLHKQNMPLPEAFESYDKPNKGELQHQCSILIIDDESAYRQAIRRILQPEGYSIMMANDGFQAGLLIMQHKPDLITLDLAMPGLDGFEVLSFIREQPELSKVKVLVISGMDRAQLAKAQQVGADAVLSKPFENNELIQLVNSLLLEG
ncbi:response regulator [Arsukibacterium sp.]|uniref:response regulator n=1 Tax=Arsukibacterium sp. TaxID=1977258 RepID=UPI002FDB0D87